MAKRRIKVLLALTVLFSVLLCLQFVGAEETLRVYRAFNLKTGEHLYTTSGVEIKTLTAPGGGWRDEGIGWNAPYTGEPVYRLYNPDLGIHLYTTDKNEVEILTTEDTWEKDFDGKPIFYSGGSQNIYRLYDENTGQHHWTTDLHEYEVLPKEGWTQEGVALKAASKAVTTTPVIDKTPINPSGSNTIENTESEFAIEADVTLTGSGTGYHAKLVACTPLSAVSFGLQHDVFAEGQYGGETAFLVENVANNNKNGQTYTRAGYGLLDHNYKLLLTVSKDGVCDFYVNGAKVKTVNNPLLAGKMIYLRVEGSARLNGDSVIANFSNIKVKGHGIYDPEKVWGTHNFDTNSTIHSTDNFAKNKSVFISGTISGLTSSQDWDSAYEGVSGIIQFVE